MIKPNLLLAVSLMLALAGAAYCAEISTAAAAESVAKTEFAKRLESGAVSIVIGQPNPKHTVKSVHAQGERSDAFVVDVVVERTHDGPVTSITYTTYVMKVDGRMVLGEAKGTKPGISPYASLSRSSKGFLGVLNQMFKTMEYTAGDDFAAKAHGDHYYCLMMLGGKRFLGRMPVKPLVAKLPEWARTNKEHLENGLAARMFRDAYPIDLLDEKFLKLHAATDADVRTAVSLYPSLAKRLGLAVDPAVKPLKLEGWAKHGDIYAQDCAERCAAELLLHLDLVRALKTWEHQDMMLVGDGTSAGTLFAAFDNRSIHYEVNWGRPVDGAFHSVTGKVHASMAKEIASGNDAGTVYAMNFPELRALLEKAAATSDDARAALAKLPKLE